MAASEDILRVLDYAEIEELLKVLETDLPSSALIYNWIKTQIRWAKELPHIKVRIMCPYGDWTDGTVVALVDGLGTGIEFGACYTMEKDGQKLKRALLETKVIQWNKFSHFSAVIARHIPICYRALTDIGLDMDDGIFSIIAHTHYISAQEAAAIEIPEIPPNVRVGDLDVSHVDTVCKYWIHYDPNFRPVVEQMIRLNRTTGVFVKNDDGAEELAAMILQSEYGGLGILQTVPGHQRKGYALLALRRQIKVLGEAGVNVHCHVIVQNFKSIELFKKSGMKIVETSNWVCVKGSSEVVEILKQLKTH